MEEELRVRLGSIDGICSSRVRLASAAVLDLQEVLSKAGPVHGRIGTASC